MRGLLHGRLRFRLPSAAGGIHFRGVAILRPSRQEKADSNGATVMSDERTVGYIGVDAPNSATVRNEIPGLLREGVSLDMVSVSRRAEPTARERESLGRWADEIHYLYPMGFFRAVWSLAAVVFVFRGRFFRALWGTICCPAATPGERMRVLYCFLPAACLAMYWRDKRIGHIHAQRAHTAATVAMHAAVLLGVGFSFTGHDHNIFVHRVGLLGKIRRARFIVCISEYHRRVYLALGADPRRLQVVYRGIDPQHFAVPADRSTVTAKPPRIIAVGRLVEKKGFDHLIDACDLLRERGVDFRCIIAGSGPWLNRLIMQVANRNLNKLVRITGESVSREELPRLLQSATVFALPCVRDRKGDMDGLPRVLIEAMAARLPVVSTRLVGIPDLVRHRLNGSLVASGNTTELADELQRMLVDSDLRNHLATEAEWFARAYFDREESVRRLKRLFLWAASTPGNGPPDFQFTAAEGAEACYGDRLGVDEGQPAQATDAPDEPELVELTRP